MMSEDVEQLLKSKYFNVDKFLDDAEKLDPDNLWMQSAIIHYRETRNEWTLKSIIRMVEDYIDW
ncbi:MAG: hypothetical protein ACE5KT_08665 [Methanosarcinales archaeon]